MSIIKNWSLFTESKKYGPYFHCLEESWIENTFSISPGDIKDLVQDILDEGIHCRVESQKKESRLSVFDQVDSILLKFGKDPGPVTHIGRRFDGYIIKKAIPDIKSHLKGYGLKILYITDISKRSVGVNVFITHSWNKTYDFVKKDRSEFL